MTPEQNEGNKLIAEFMGYNQDGLGKWFKDGILISYHFDYFKYHSSWDWLMPVVEKIEKEGYEISISSQMEYINDDTETYWHQDCCISSDNQEIVNTTGKSKINSVYAAVVQFIQWYNTQNKQP